jgi:TonB family protein
MTPYRHAVTNPLTWICGSVVFNVALWASLAVGTNRQIARSGQRELIFERITMDEHGHKKIKVVEPKKIKEIVKKLRENLPKPKPEEPAHSRIVTAKPNPAAPNPGPAVLPDGNAKLGAPVVQQAGNGTGEAPPKTDPVPPKTDPTPPPKVDPTPPPKVDPTPPPKVDPTPPPAPPPPPPPPPVKPKGPSRDAEATSTVQPTIPDSLLSQEFKKSVRVRVHIAPDGSFTVELRSSCGNAEVDKLALDALRRWKWRPKLVDGEPQADVQTFRFEFEVK